jgi:glycosyltransferase involved in cell wall biosynthesis
MGSEKKILIIVFSNLKHDARLKRQISFLKDAYSLTVLCFDGEDISGVKIIRLKQTPLTLVRKAFSGLFLLSGFYKVGHRILHDYAYLIPSLKEQYFDLVIANDVETLPLAFGLNTKVLFDAHEYAPRHFEDKLWWRIFFKGLNNYLCRKYIPMVQAMTTVGDGLANEYQKNFGVQPIVITNASYYHELNPSTVNDNSIRMVYHGIANASRRLELMIEMMAHLDSRFTLDLILMQSDFASGKTKQYIENLATSIKNNDRINILPQLPSHEIVRFINQYDIGVFLIPPVNFNYANTLPNKLFEYIQARLAIAVGPTPEMAAIVRRYDIGFVSEDFSPEKLAEKINAVTTTSLIDFKSRSALAAKELSAEKNKTRLNGLVSQIFDRKE